MLLRYFNSLSTITKTASLLIFKEQNSFLTAEVGNEAAVKFLNFLSYLLYGGILFSNS